MEPVFYVICLGLAILVIPLIFFTLGSIILAFSRVDKKTYYEEAPFYGLYIKALESQERIRHARLMLKESNIKRSFVLMTLLRESAKIAWIACKTLANV